jgi:hypothetical protein
MEYLGKTIYFALCVNCKKELLISLSRPVKYCPRCSKIRKRYKQQIRRAIKEGRRRCKYCQKPLPKKYPNRVYCEGGACKQAAYRGRKIKEQTDLDAQDAQFPIPSYPEKTSGIIENARGDKFHITFKDIACK